MVGNVDPAAGERLHPHSSSNGFTGLGRGWLGDLASGTMSRAGRLGFASMERSLCGGLRSSLVLGNMSDIVALGECGVPSSSPCTISTDGGLAFRPSSVAGPIQPVGRNYSRMAKLGTVAMVALGFGLMAASLDLGQRFLALLILRNELGRDIPLWRSLTPLLMIMLALALATSAFIAAGRGGRVWLVVATASLTVLEWSLSAGDYIVPNLASTNWLILVALVGAVGFLAIHRVDGD